MPSLFRLVLGVAAILVLTGDAPAAGPPSAKQWPTELFGQTNLWEIHLRVTADDWKKMQPTRPGSFGGFGGPQNPKPLPEGRIIRGNFGFDFAWVPADLVIGNTVLKKVAVRFKGSGTYSLSQRALKRPFKIDLDRYVQGRTFLGASMLVLGNNVMDISCTREALAYSVYRAVGIPTPRTAYAAVRLSVPGKYDRELVGLYTLTEAVDRTFLEKHFGSAKGLLMKPERVGPLEHLGTEWDEYDARYRPKTRASDKAKQKLIALTRLVQYGDDERFAREIGKYIDIDRVLRYLAATAMLSSTDSFMGLAHNYYLYFDPKKDRFSIIPWDTDLAFAGLLMGSAPDLMDLSIRQPHMGRNPLVERLLADDKHFAAYKGHLQRLLKHGFTAAGLKRDQAAIRAVIDPVLALERIAVAARKEPRNQWGGAGGMLARAPALDTFVPRRIASVESQLAGKSQGKQMRSAWGGGMGGMGMGPGVAIARAILREADKDKDKALSKQELADGLTALLKHLQGASERPLDEKALIVALDKIVPRQPPPRWGFPPPGKEKEKAKEKPKDKKPGPPSAQAIDLARSMVERGGERGAVSSKRLLAAAERFFLKHDRDKNGKLDERELGAALQDLLPTPVFRMPAVERPVPVKGK